MDLTNTDTVRPQDERPARRDGTCFFCRAPMGTRHEASCVIVSKTVVMRFTVEVVMDIPRDWDERQIDFRYNESSWCASNLFADLGRWEERNGDERCGCFATSAKFLRDATPEDHRAFPVLMDPED